MIDRHIILIGFSGSGKSTVGPRLARGLRRRFVDIDASIEKKTHISIAEIFSSRGERAFRGLEKKAIEKALRSQSAAVFALGGGAFENRGIRKESLEHAIVVYLSCSRREIYRRLKNKADRPLLEVQPRGLQTLRDARLARIGGLLKKRLANYRKAHLVVSTTRKTPAVVTRELLKLLRRR